MNSLRILTLSLRYSVSPAKTVYPPSISKMNIIGSLDDPLSIYCVNRPPGSRYPSPSHKGSLPKCSIIRRLRKRLKIGRR
jgi:hypothetical protein